MTAACQPSPSPVPVPVEPPAGGLPLLVEYLRRVPDPWRCQGKPHPLGAIWLLVVVATLAVGSIGWVLQNVQNGDVGRSRTFSARWASAPGERLLLARCASSCAR
jgi:hypothetical protein